MLCLWLLILTFALLMLTLSDLLKQGRGHSLHKPAPPRRPLQRFLDPSELEVIVDSRDPALELGVDLAPLKTLQEDQLLLVPSTQGMKNPPQGKRSYKVLLPGAGKETPAPRTPAHGELGRAVRMHLGGLQKDMERAALQKYGFNELVSERISLRRTLPDTRHPE